jgi:hypothetical protein
MHRDFKEFLGFDSGTFGLAYRCIPNQLHKCLATNGIHGIQSALNTKDGRRL